MMNAGNLHILAWARLPGRLNVENTATLLGVATHDIPVLVAARHLVPLDPENGNRSTVKYFATIEVLRLASDVKWLCKATRIIRRYWLNKNGRRRNT